MKKQNTIIAWLIILTLLIGISYCDKSTYKYKDIDKRKIENTILETKVQNTKESFKSIDKQIDTYVTIKDTLKQSNINTYKRYKDTQTETETIDRTIVDTLIENQRTEIKVQDTIIHLQDSTIKLRDTVIHDLEIINLNFEDMLTDTEQELIKSNKKNKRKNIWIWISTGIATILTIILLVQ